METWIIKYHVSGIALKYFVDGYVPADPGLEYQELEIDTCISSSNDAVSPFSTIRLAG